ncbi:structural cement protein Gp24 [Sphingomonas faeni]|uniref:structural cement protein Gp24 n=1 Tax=Sphingomonas faeni TaxID=185950 RepID=UPI0033565BAF
MPLQTTYPQFQPAGFPGMHMDMSEWDGTTKTATAAIAFGAPVQRVAGGGCAPLTTGEYIGIATTRRITGATGDGFAQYDNVPVANEGKWGALADAAIAEGAAVNWNSATGRWTTAAVAGAIYAVPGAEADTAATGAGSFFSVRLRRIPS